jgi:hypothetical protein
MLSSVIRKSLGHSSSARSVLSLRKYIRPSRPVFGGGGGHQGGHDEPHIPVGHARLGKALMCFTFLWIFYRAKQDKGQLFGLYYPWLDEHEHEPEFKFTRDGTGSVPFLVEHEDEEEHDVHEEEHDDHKDEE